jgi:hypothetical protein
MMESWRPLVCAVALVVTVGIGVSDAQTVIVTNAPPESKVELVFNTSTVGSATVGADGEATLSVDPLAKAGKTETSVHVWVDSCTNLVRVLLVEGGLPPPPSGACVRNQVAGLFIVRAITTLVFDVSRAEPLMWLRQGPAPAEWLGAMSAAGAKRGRTWGTAPTSLVFFGGANLAAFGNAVTSACGNVATCSGTNHPLGYRVGGAYWIKPFLAAEVSYLKAGKLTTNGTGDGFHFQTLQDTQLVTLTGNVGIPVGPVRIYGQAGGNYHRATSRTTETIDASGTQVFTLRTEGWGWLFGGGAEVWMTKYAAFYGELGVAKLRGSALEGGQGTMDDHVTFIVLGGKVHVGR